MYRDQEHDRLMSCSVVNGLYLLVLLLVSLAYAGNVPKLLLSSPMLATYRR